MADKFLMVLLRLCLQPGVSYLYSRPGRMCAALGIERVWRISENGETRARSERKTVRPSVQDPSRMRSSSRRTAVLSQDSQSSRARDSKADTPSQHSC